MSFLCEKPRLPGLTLVKLRIPTNLCYWTCQSAMYNLIFNQEQQVWAAVIANESRERLATSGQVQIVPILPIIVSWLLISSCIDTDSAMAVDSSCFSQLTAAHYCLRMLP